MSNKLRWALTAIGLVPLLCKLPYMLQAWRISPLDRGEWGFALAFLVMLAGSYGVLTARRKPTGCDWSALPAALAALAGIAVGYRFEIHAIGILAAIGFGWSMVWLSWGWRGALALLPAYGMLALAGTSTRYWLAYFSGPLQWNGLTVKLVLAVLLAAWWGVTLRYEWRIRWGTFLFYACFAGVLVLIRQADLLQETGMPYTPHFSVTAHPDYLGREQIPTENDLRFFGDCVLKKYFFASDTGSVSVLALEAGSNIHKIHPASHCLRSGGWNIQREQIHEVDIGNRRFQVTEIEASLPELSLIVWIWYSNDRFSTANFLGFRRNWNPDEKWHIYQVSTPLHLSVTEARQQLTGFLSGISAD